MKNKVRKIFILIVLVIIALFLLSLNVIADEEYSDINYFSVPVVIRDADKGFAINNNVEGNTKSYFKWYFIDPEISAQMDKIEEEWMEYLSTRGEFFKQNNRSIINEVFEEDVNKIEGFEKRIEELIPDKAMNTERNWRETESNEHVDDIIKLNFDEYEGELVRIILWVKMENEKGEIGLQHHLYKVNPKTKELYRPVKEYLELKPLTLKKGDIIPIEELFAYTTHPVDWYEFTTKEFNHLNEVFDSFSADKSLGTSFGNPIIEIKDGKVYAKNVGASLISARNKNSSKSYLDKTIVNVIPDTYETSIIVGTSLNETTGSKSDLNTKTDDIINQTEINNTMEVFGFEISIERIIIIVLALLLLISLISNIIFKKRNKKIVVE